MEIQEKDLELIERWLTVLSNPQNVLRRFNKNDYSKYGEVAIKRCLDLLIEDGVIIAADKTQPSLYFGVHDPNSGQMPTIAYYKEVYAKQIKKAQAEAAELEKIQLEINELKARPKVSKATIRAAWSSLAVSIIAALASLVHFLFPLFKSV